MKMMTLLHPTPRQKSSHARHITLYISLLLFFWASIGFCKSEFETASDVPQTFDPILPEEIHGSTLQAIMQSLNYEHFRQIEVNDLFSKTLFSHYLNTLDPLRLHFSAQDIEALKRYEYTMDEVIQTGELKIPFEIFHVYRNRSRQRYLYMLNLLDDPAIFEFQGDEHLIIERDEMPWPVNERAIMDLWTKQVKEAALRLALAERTTEEIRSTLSRRYLAKINYLAQTKAEDIFQSFMNAVTELYDPHTQYLSPSASDNFNINMSLSLEGIGAVLQNEDEYTKVVRLVPGGPADSSGMIKPLDKIIAVGSSQDELTDIVGWRIDEVVSLIRGPKGTDVYLEIQSAESKTKTSQVVKITRNTVKLEDQATRHDIMQIKRGTKNFTLGILEIPTFYADFEGRSKGDPSYRRVSDDVEKILASSDMKSIDGLVIDLRANGGGSLQEANRLLGLFLRTGPTVQIKNTRSQISLTRDSNPKLLFDKPIVVLIDRLSASASEIFAGAMQDYQRGLIVGSRSFGKGTVQILRALDHGQLKMTHAKFYRISGESNQHQGIVPDIEMISHFDPTEVGESALENALPWDRIKPALFRPYYQLNQIIPLLTEKHLQRLDENSEYQYHIEEVELAKQIRKDTQVSLNKSIRAAEIEALENQRLTLENQRRKHRNMELLNSYEDLEAYESKQKNNQAMQVIRQDDVILYEAAEVLADMLELESKKLIVSNINTEESTSLFEFFGEILN